ncbi:MAG TPA: hypothetical protein VIF14_05545 [Alphaproteobacteria bacterium]|jgi:hypothetical protein
MPGEQHAWRGAGAARPVDRRVAAESAIEQALAELAEQRAPSVDQLSDLADAIDSLNEGAFDVAADLAMVARQGRTLAAARRPQSMARTLPDMKAAFESARRFRAQRDLPD